MDPGFPKRMLVVGLGLMGGSLAMAVRIKYPGVSVRGVDYPHVLARARERGAIEGGSPPEGLGKEAGRADLVVLAVPVSSILSLLESVVSAVPPGCVVTDLGSTKVEICGRAREILPEGGTFVGGHPFCGSEKSGIGFADPAIFSGAPFVLTPLDGHARASCLLRGFLEGLGARVLFMSPGEHDLHAARMSHLPRLIAVALCRGAHLQGERRGLIGGGFRDLTRGASSNPGIWKDILATNRRPILEALDEFEKDLNELRESLHGGGEEEFHSLFAEAGRIRRSLVAPGTDCLRRPSRYLPVRRLR